MSYTLGIDTSNYATSLAVFDTAGEVVCAKKRFLPVKEGQLGLRQSDALFHHTAALPGMLAELGAEFDLTQIAAVGVSEKPRPVEGSYMPCFLAGVSAGQAFALGRGVPLVRTTHQQGHAAAALFAAQGEKLFREKVLLFHISGGTTDLLLCDEVRSIELLGTSSDLYAGQAVDRLGVKLGFGFPAGAEVSRLAAECTEEVKPKSSVKGMACSLSGLENQSAGRREKPGLRLQILPAVRSRHGGQDDPGGPCAVSRPAGGLRRRRHEQRDHPGLGAAAAAGGPLRARPVRQRQRHRRVHPGSKGGRLMAEVITVTALNRYVKALLDGSDLLYDLALRGEVANFVRNAKSGHERPLLFHPAGQPVQRQGGDVPLGRPAAGLPARRGDAGGGALPGHPV